MEARPLDQKFHPWYFVLGIGYGTFVTIQTLKHFPGISGNISQLSWLIFLATLFLQTIILRKMYKDSRDGPEQRWSDMYAGDRLAYYFPVIVQFALGGMLLLLVVPPSPHMSIDWMVIAFTALWFTFTGLTLFHRWSDRNN